MATVSSTLYVNALREIEFCPYADNCAYADSCVYGKRRFESLANIENAITQTGKSLLGAACLLVGFALTLTLWLLPISIPLALLGIAFPQTAKERR